MNRERLSYSHYTERRLGNDYSYSQIQKNMTYDSGDDYPSRPTRDQYLEDADELLRTVYYLKLNYPWLNSLNSFHRLQTKIRS